MFCIIQAPSLNTYCENVHLLKKANLHSEAVSKHILQAIIIIHAIFPLFISTSAGKGNGYFFVVKPANSSYYKITGSTLTALENCCIYSQDQENHLNLKKAQTFFFLSFIKNYLEYCIYFSYLHFFSPKEEYHQFDSNNA